MLNLKNKISNLLHKIDDKDINPNCSQFEVNNWSTSRFVLKKIIPVTGYHPFPINELMLLVSAVVRLKPTHIFEWGTNIGKSARIFYETAKYYNINAEIHSIDLPDDIEHQEHPHQDRGKLVRNIKQVNLHLGDGLDKSFEIYNNLSGKKNVKPLFFLDGDHSYNSVSRELTAIVENVENPIILVHDTFYQDEKSGYNIGPYLAVKELLEKSQSSFKVIRQDIGLPGLTLLFK